MGELKMDNFVDDRDFKLLDNDKYTFFVLKKILGFDCKIKLSDHEKIIFCFSCEPFPVWIWTPDDATEDDYKKAYEIAKEYELLDGKHNFNVKYELAEYFISRAAKEGEDLGIVLNMFAYDCLNPIALTDEVDGSIYECTSDDLDELIEFEAMFHEETGVDKTDYEGYRKLAQEHIAEGNLYFWKNAEGKKIASCRFAPDGDMASIGLVYTLPEYRRKHYAEHLVYQVTRKAEAAGFVPMLYTNADYEASNACYEKIGYVLRGNLCSIGAV